MKKLDSHYILGDREDHAEVGSESNDSNALVHPWTCAGDLCLLVFHFPSPSLAVEFTVDSFDLLVRCLSQGTRRCCKCAFGLGLID